MALTWSVYCSRCKSVFQIYDEEALYLMGRDTPIICGECEREIEKKGILNA